MSKEELKQEAEEYSQKACGYIRVEIVQAFLAGAKPRDKQIASLEAKLTKAKEIIKVMLKIHYQKKILKIFMNGLLNKQSNF